MNTTKEQKVVEGVLEAINVKFNGSFMVDGAWHNFKKGVVRPTANKGDMVKLTLESWEFKDKKGMNIVKAEVISKEDLGNAAHPANTDKTRLELIEQKYGNPHISKASTGTMSKEEWQSKDTRISRQGVIQVAVQIASDFDKAVVLANKMLEFVNGK